MSIEQLCKGYPDVPRSIILKTDTLRLGVQFSQSALEAVKGMNICFKGTFIFSKDIGLAKVSKEKIPFTFVLKSDETRIRVLFNPLSPYVIDCIDGKFVFCDETGTVEEVYFDPAPKWASQTFDDGTPFQMLAQPIGSDGVLGFLSFLCDRWTRKEQCLFCDVGNFLERRKQTDKDIIINAKPEMLAQVMAAARREPQIRHLCLTSGSVIGKRDGKSEIEWYCEYLHAINEKIMGDWMSSYVAIQPRKKDEIKILHDAGAPALMMNWEVWGERLFNILCPGKASLIGWEEGVRRLIDAVDVYGKGRILSNFVAGVEMAQPWGFKDPLSAVKHTLSGFDYLMAHGVLPRMTTWTVESGSALAGQQVPPLEYYVEIQRGYLELRKKYNFTFPFYGFCRGCYINDTIPEWDYYFWGK